MTVVVPDYSPRPAPLGLSPSAAPAPAPVPGSDGDEDGTPRLPSERRGTGAPSSTGHSASAQAPAAATSTDFVSSSPAVPLPAGVTDSATVLPMPTPGQHLRVTSPSPLLSSLKKIKIMACIVFFLSFSCTSTNVSMGTVNSGGITAASLFTLVCAFRRAFLPSLQALLSRCFASTELFAFLHLALTSFPPLVTTTLFNLQDDVGMGTRRLQARVLQLAVPLLIMLSFGATSVSAGVVM